MNQTSQIDNQYQFNQPTQTTRMNIIELSKEQFVGTISETPKELTVAKEFQETQSTKQQANKPTKIIREKGDRNGT